MVSKRNKDLDKSVLIFSETKQDFYKHVPNKIIRETGFVKNLPKTCFTKFIAIQTTTKLEEYTIFICICMFKYIRTFKNIFYYILNHT
jgi:hypothetical protein